MFVSFSFEVRLSDGFTFRISFFC